MGNMDKGWIKLSRNITDHWLWKDRPFSRGQAWIDLILSANHEEKKVLFDGKLIVIRRGQQVTSIRKLSDRWGWNKRTTKRFLSMLETDGMLSMECTTRCTTLTIVNYGKYQNRSTTKSPLNAPQSARPSAPQSAHKQESIRKIKKEKEIPLPSEEILYGIPDDEIEWEDEEE